MQGNEIKLKNVQQTINQLIEKTQIDIDVRSKLETINTFFGNCIENIKKQMGAAKVNSI